MVSNQVIAALHIENNEIRILVGQFFRDSFNVIAKHTAVCRGMDGIRIIDEGKAIDSIREATNAVSAMLSAPLKSVLLIIPAHRFKREKRTFDTLLPEHEVRYSDIRSLIKESYRSSVGHDYEIINVSCANYRINGITYPKIPLKEKGDILTSETDLICGDRLITYDYVKLVEKAGLKVMDICQDGFASCKEAAIFEQSLNSYMINIYLAGAHTVYSLICNGRLAAGFSSANGFNVLVKPIMDRFHLSYKDASRLLLRYGHIGQKEGEDRLINRWKDGDREMSITYNELQQAIAEASDKFVESIYSYCSNIVNYDNVSVIITGQGASLQDLDTTLEACFKKKVTCYCPETLGVREPKWAPLLGIFYEYKEVQQINETALSSVDMNVYAEHLLPQDNEEEGNSLADRFKSITEKLFTDDEEE